MRIALIHYQLRRSGGMESYLIDLVRGFAAAGDAVEVWVRGLDAGLAAELPCAVRRVPVAPLPRIARNWAFARAVGKLRLRERCDLVITLARAPGAHLAVNGGTHPGFLAAMSRRAALRDRLEIRLERECVHSAALVVAHSRLLARELRQYYALEGERVRVIYPPVDTRRFAAVDSAQRRAARSALGLAEDDFAFLFPSTGHERKGLPALLEAFNRLASPQARLLIAGRPANLKADGRVRALGYVADMPALYAAVDCTVLPARYEPFGLVIAESLQCATPVIVSAQAGAAELMDASDGIRLETCDAEALLPALRRMLSQRTRPQSGFAQRKGLDLAAHIEALRDCAAAAVRAHI